LGGVWAGRGDVEGVKRKCVAALYKFTQTNTPVYLPIIFYHYLA